MSPKPKAPRWLTESFRDGVDERDAWPLPGAGVPAYGIGEALCQLRQHDLLQRPCSGRLERIHYVNRQRIENAMGVLLLGAVIDDGIYRYPFDRWMTSDLILLAAWDPRVGGIACQGMHRRFDNHATPPLIVPYDALPSHVIDWAESWGLESQLEARCPRREVVS